MSQWESVDDWITTLEQSDFANFQDEDSDEESKSFSDSEERGDDLEDENPGGLGSVAALIPSEDEEIGDENPDGSVRHGPFVSQDHNPTNQIRGEEEEKKEESDFNPGAEGAYPPGALSHPFPPTALIKTHPLSLRARCYYLGLRKTNSSKKILFWIESVDGGIFRLRYRQPFNPGSLNFSETAIEDFLGDYHTFQVSEPCSFDDSPSHLSSEDELVTGESYLFIPKAHPHRVKLMGLYSISEQGIFSFRWAWRGGHLLPKFSLSLMKEIILKSEVYKVSWPETGGVTFTAGEEDGFYSVEF